MAEAVAVRTQRIVKVDTKLGLVFGWAIVCKAHGKPYFDRQGHHITEDAMLEAAADFAANSRVTKAMHRGAPDRPAVFLWPLTTELCKSFGIESENSGLLIGIRPSAEILKKFEDGTYTGFSLNGETPKASIEYLDDGGEE